MAKLLQVSSAFGRAMETVDGAKISRVIYPDPPGQEGRRCRPGVAGPRRGGVPFPSNLDLDANVDGRYNGAGYDERLELHDSVGSIAEACTRSLAEHRSVHLAEVR